jgi:Cu2+-exporting ATPase
MRILRLGEAHISGGETVSIGAGMSHHMTHDMGDGAGVDMKAMVRDMRNRFWISLVFAVPIFIYSPMGNMFTPPAPPFGLA